MKKNVKFIGSTLLVFLVMIACENNQLEQVSDFNELKKANMGMIKAYDNAMVLTWNEALSKAIDTKVPAPVEARIYAMVSLTVHDALNNVVPKYETYALDNSWNDGKEVSKKTIYQVADAAVAQAAHDVLIVLYPAWKADADILLTSSLSGIMESEEKSLGIQVGKDAATAILMKRQNDASPGFEAYPQGTEPGQYKSTIPYKFAITIPPFWPANSVYAPRWGETEPFGLISGDQFRPEPPYEINSPEYTADYNEVKSLGSNTSSVRTQDQTNMSMFFTDNIPSMLNRVAREMAVKENLNGWETARLFAFIEMAAADVLISTFDGAFYYNFWRPVTAIQEGNGDGNDDTAGDAIWSPLTTARPTPPLPSYPSAYAAGGGAGAELFKIFFKTDKKSFTIESYSLPDSERSYTSFSQFSTEMNVSRIYAGHNFRNDQIAGEQMGKKIAKYVYENNLKELKVSQLKK
jgi:hypothetical protein